MDFKTFDSRMSPNGKVTFCRMGLVKGRNRLLAAGFKQCRSKKLIRDRI
jgi:hypothetical protein